MSDMEYSPLTLDDSDWGVDEVQAICFSRIFMTDSEWEEDEPHEWDISRDEAATRIDEEDWSPPDWYQSPD